MKTDKELLELAEKAAHSVNKNILTIGCPLTDDGDALRLAVALKLLVDTDYNDCVAAGCCQLDEILEPIGNDRLAATRRAIVRAAAAIGERL